MHAAEASLDEVLDWLCMHVEAAELPAKLRGRHSGGVTVLRTGGPGEASASSLDDEWAAVGDPSVATLMQFGYAVSDAVAALRVCDGDAAGAWALLFARATGTEAPVDTRCASAVDVGPPSPNAATAVDPAALAETLPDGSGGGASTAVWLDELVVLHSMYGPDVLVANAGCLQLALPVSENLASYYGNTPTTATLVVMHCPSAGYPQTLPVFGLRCNALPPAVRVAWVARTAEYMRESGALGAPMLHELVEALRQSLASLPDGRAMLPTAARRRYCKLMADTNSLQGALSVPQVAVAAQGREPPPRRQRGVGFGAEEAKAEGARLQKLLERNRVEGGERAVMRAAREKLPAYAMRGKVLDAVRGHRVTIIAGATGCGKSTQVCFSRTLCARSCTAFLP
jgi:hypothetical protein